MEQLGTMDPEKLLQLLLGVISCAFVMIVVTAVYIVLARRMRHARSGAAEQIDRYTGTIGVNETLAQPAAPDVAARLINVGRAGWETEDVDVSRVRPARCAPEVLRIVWDASSGQVVVRIGGTRYTRLGDVRDRAVGKRILAAITWALRFSGGKVAENDGVKTLELPQCDAVRVPEPFPGLADEDEPGEIARLLADTQRNEFWIQAAGRSYARLTDVPDAEVARRILEAISYLLQFSYGRLMANDGVRSVPIPQLSAKPAAPVARALSVAAGTPQVSTSEPTRDRSEQFFEQLMRESTGPERPLARRAGKSTHPTPTKAQDVPAFNLVEEIDRIFQRKLEASPLAHLDAQFVARPDGGVRIRVGTKFYDRPDEVPDPELRKIIEAAITEW